MTEEQVLEYLRNEQLSSMFLFKLWVYSILPCWIRGHRISRKDRDRFLVGKSVRCMKCKKKIS